MMSWRKLRLSKIPLMKPFTTSPRGINSPLLDQLDKSLSPDTVLKMSGRVKIRRGLESKKSQELIPGAEESLDTLSMEILEVLEKSLASRALAGLFDEISVPSDVVQFNKVKVNQDLSHVDVFWESDILESFVLKANEKLGSLEGEKIRKKLFNGVNSKLQQKESRFRTQLMRTIHLRRVPR